MPEHKAIRVALVGNPNTGKTSLFNQLTGLNQKVGNYPGITVDKKVGKSQLGKDMIASVIDLPGTYSINPTSIDENIVLQTLLNQDHDDFPDVIVVVADVENIKRNLLLYSQIKDLQIPTVLAINMADQLALKGVEIDLETLKNELKSEVVLVSARKNQGIDDLKKVLIDYKKLNTEPLATISSRIDKLYFEEMDTSISGLSLYKTWLYVTQMQEFPGLDEKEIEIIQKYKQDQQKIKKYQHKETIFRYQQINAILKKTYSVDRSKAKDLRSRLDRVLTHRIFGYLIFALILMMIFQSIFDWANVPMDYIDAFFAELSSKAQQWLPEGKLSDLISEGVIPGIGGIVIFIPQIAILFLFVSILEETGYMSRVVFLMDKIMRRFGMSGKSVVPLISGTACAIPAVMATRNISGWKERLITILVVPFVTCSARLPVYAIIIALIIPDDRVLGIFSLQGMTLLGLYLLGFLMAIVSGFVLHKTLKVEGKSFFLIEMPDYKLPSMKNVFFTVIEKTKAFVFGAGKIILAISIILWFLASNGPAAFDTADKDFQAAYLSDEKSSTSYDEALASYKLENSYIGVMGKSIEPAIRPLGYDWKIGIALIASFAAREVFVGTLATIYSVGNDDEEQSTIKQRMSEEINETTGEKLFNLPVGMSLLIFYAFAMQCVSTLAIVKRETNSWKWPLIQLMGMGLIAYLASFITFSILN
ncbi:ferrous iron transport protein B [Lutimonas zeaxanthinifaciens]|uniref:ferrous iron transport protein B n=1 Tax=Lutimonas zeaxanthinifaciens TaxID=3060215 RepID=UPI00265D2911|nr:ferrous iron transport protein B [Lutimonas sp. YSD2104]WKK65481.1 ferrous iron transport protein B [Lutimonas sp. YSD2104]